MKRRQLLLGAVGCAVGGAGALPIAEAAAGLARAARATADAVAACVARLRHAQEMRRLGEQLEAPEAFAERVSAMVREALEEERGGHVLGL